MKLMIGLGNPGPQYSCNRHNIGFLAIDEIANTYNFPNFKIKKNCLLSEGEIGGEKIILLKPLSFMNQSGIAVSEFIRFYKVSLDHIYIFHDDLDLHFGKVKVKHGGSHAGHNGLKSLDAHVGNSYWRIRIGIDHPGHKELVTHYVLGDFSPRERDKLPEILDTIAQHLPTLFSNNAERFQNDIALQLNTERL